MSEKRKRNIIITVLSCIVLLMAVGYAAFQSVLNINGTSNITSNWDVEITGITKDKAKGNVTEISKPTFEKENATFNVGLESPGDYIYYKVEVTNKGTLAAIAKIGNLSCGDNSALECGAYASSTVTSIIGSNTDLENKRLIIGPNETEYYNIGIKYKDDITKQPAITNTNIKLALTYEQSEVGITHQTDDKCYTGKVLKNGTISITDYDKNCGTEVVIPETIKGYTVTEIADGRYDSVNGLNISAFAKKGITSVVIPNTVTYIGMYAFIGNNISNLVLGSSVETIREEAFLSNKLTNVILPSSLKLMYNTCFGINNLTEINIPSSVTYLGGGVFTGNNVPQENAFIYGRDADGSINNTVLDSYAGKTAENVAIPPAVETISNRAFVFIPINNLEVPATVKTIRGQAFYNAGIKNLKLNEGLGLIDYRAFGNNSLTNITIPNSVKTIGKMAFHLNPILMVNIGNGIQSIGVDAFGPQTTSSLTININRKTNSVTGSPWGATNAIINWTS